jgi:hypothetical protein
VELSTVERVGPSKIDQSEVGRVIRLARRLAESPNSKKPTASRGAAGVWNHKSGDRIRGCDGARATLPTLSQELAARA